ncbi:aldose 1-epimerase [Ruania alkalisoli]|uniref:Aldose 1-epimerase n=1 Tax=Ruania alkalisoli TaxID=2779775 RepID=A0A7M1SSE4_9MICO|nr:aldose 1-epimerase [Ruania alkalisoli]QOR70067.1 aldose 1-epimerase [Ruania alkalisoli]
MRAVEHQETAVSGWPALGLSNERVELTVVPGKGADITSMIDRSTGTELMWSTRWGLRPPTALAPPGNPEAEALDRSGGGWHTLFPNAGRACVEQGVEWGFHGEAWLAPYECAPTAAGLRLHTTLARSPFAVVKDITLDGDRVRVTETVTHIGAHPVDVMWWQHPTFGAPLIGPDTTISITGCSVHPDMPDDIPGTAPPPRWPEHHPPGAEPVDLSRLTAARVGGSRLAFLGEFDSEQVCAQVRNPTLGLGVDVEWLASDFPYACYWYEAGGRLGYPWYGAAHGFSIEPATGYPSGLARARALTGTELSIGPEETVSKSVTVRVRSSR